jgi:hypothetical protein
MKKKLSCHHEAMYTDMTIHWKALEEHFLKHHVFQFVHFWGKCIFWKKSVVS